jgi:two-component system, OmpR family, alkaline phosphatase synthesis response regulator PhoP
MKRDKETSMERHRPLVLVADDDEDILELVRFRLAGGGYDTICAHDGTQALALAAERLPDVAVLDVSMPGLDGVAITEQMRSSEATRRIPVILLTASANPGDVAKGLAAGAEDYVTKPFSPELLESRVSAVLKAAAALREPGRLNNAIRRAEAIG